MTADAGLEVLRMDTAGEVADHKNKNDDDDDKLADGEVAQSPAAHSGRDSARKVAIRNRGAGTSEPANA